jgi:hypothetical protein
MARRKRRGRRRGAGPISYVPIVHPRHHTYTPELLALDLLRQTRGEFPGIEKPAEACVVVRYPDGRMAVSWSCMSSDSMAVIARTVTMAADREFADEQMDLQEK